MTEKKYNTKDIRHIDEKNQEYIAEGNRMTKEIKIGKKDVVACNYWEACDYYKQLKRLEQENETIINEYNKLQAEIIGDIEFKELMLTGITPLKVLQNLKERNRELQAFYDVHESFKTDFDTNRKLLENYRSALEEIKAMLYFRPEYCKSCEDFKNGYCIGLSLGNCEYDFHNKILDKINEVLK